MLHEKLRCYQKAVELAEELSKEVASWPRGFGYLADQLKRAMASVVLNIAEGNARKAHKERRRFFEIARASASEVSSCLDLSQAFGLIPAMRAIELKSQIEIISKMIWGLMRR